MPKKAVALYDWDHVLLEPAWRLEKEIETALRPILEGAMKENLDMAHLEVFIQSWVSMEVIFLVSRRKYELPGK